MSRVLSLCCLFFVLVVDFHSLGFICFLRYPHFFHWVVKNFGVLSILLLLFLWQTPKAVPLQYLERIQFVTPHREVRHCRISLRLAYLPSLVDGGSHVIYVTSQIVDSSVFFVPLLFLSFALL